jgi:hypothetical protein
MEAEKEFERQYKFFKREVLIWLRLEYSWWFDWKIREGWRIDCKKCLRANLSEESIERLFDRYVYL